MEEVIVDTSLAVKWFVEEENSDKALGLLKNYKEGQIKIIVPEIIALELANALFFGAGFEGNILKKSLEAFYLFDFPTVNLEEDIILGASKYMEKFKIAIYDAIFIYLADLKKIPLITADIKHHKKTYSKEIKYLNEL